MCRQMRYITERVGIKVWVCKRYMTDWLVVMRRYITDLVGMTSLAGFQISEEVLWYSYLFVETMTMLRCAAFPE